MTEAAIVCEPAGTFELKGKPEPVVLWRAVRVSAARRGVGRSAGLDPPFVGRERELRLLKDVFHATEGGRAHLVTVTGIAGIGKSRLAWEFEKYADGLADEVLWHRGRCLSYGEGVAFWALAEMVRMRARIAEDDPVAIADAQARGGRGRVGVRSRATATGSRRRCATCWGWRRSPTATASGSSRPGAGSSRRWPSGCRSCSCSRTCTGPTSRCSRSSSTCSSGRATTACSCVGLARPELAERRAGFGATSRSFTSLALEPLRA